MKVSRQQIDNFLKEKKFAIAGISRNKKKFGYQVFNELRAKGYTIIPVNPNTDKIDDVTCYKSVSDLPSDVNSLLILTPRDATDNTLREALKKGIKNIWVQQMSDTRETLKIAEEYRHEIIFGKCIFMFADPVTSIHKFHRAIIKFFGGLPK